MKLKYSFSLSLIFVIITLSAYSQIGGGIKTKEGLFLASRNVLMTNCLQALKTDETNSAAKQICRCRIELLDGRYTSKQIIKYQKLYKDSAIGELIKEDKDFTGALESCIGKKSYTSFLKLPESAQRFKDSCKASFKRSLYERYIDADVDKFCSCSINILKEKKLTEEEFEDLFDVNSLLYNEVNYYCGAPVAGASNISNKWQVNSKDDIAGTVVIDTIKMIAVGGMQKLKIKIGNFTKIGMLDCGATDILLPGSLINKLLADSAFANELKFMDIGKYELANGSTIECKRYLLNKLNFGKFIVSNVIIAATEKPVTILIGRTLLNKFRKWNVDNEKNLLILEK
jgi:hypothetical protein